MALTEEQLAIIESARSRASEEGPRERLRTAAQGATFGTADEIEAFARSIVTDRPYEEVLAEIRGQLEAYREARPSEALAYEFGGAALPALAAAPFTGGASTVPTLGRLATIGALEGGAYAFGTGEGGFQERLSRVPGGAIAGGAGGAAGGLAARAIGSPFNALANAARRIVGRRGPRIVEEEIQRIVGESGLTADQAAEAIIDGRLLIENETIRRAAGGIAAQGGVPSRLIRESLQGRPEATRAQAMQELRTYLSDVSEPSALQAQRRSDEAARAAERQAYSQFEDVPAPPQVVGAVGEALRRVPAASSEVNEALMAASGRGPFISAPEIGPPSFTRTPTVSEAERIRRAIENRASALYREGMGGAGEAVSGVGEALRDVLDMSVPELATVRGQAAAIRANRDAFSAGRSAMTGDVYERLDQFSNLSDPQAIQAYRAGLMSALENRATLSSKESMIRNLMKEDTREGMLLRAVFPEEQFDQALNALSRAAESQQAASSILGNSKTTERFQEIARQGSGISGMTMMRALGNDPDAIASIVTNLLNRTGRPLNEGEMTRVVQVLTSQDPDLVRRALTDESAMATLQRAVEQFFNLSATGAAGAAGTAASAAVSPLSEGVIGGLLQMQ